MELLRNIEKLMETNGIKTKADFAKAADLPYTTVDGFWKKGTENIKLKTLKKVAFALNCTLDELIYGKGEQKEYVTILYDKLSVEGKEKTIEYMKFLLDQGYIKSNTAELVEAE